MSVTVGTSV